MRRVPGTSMVLAAVVALAACDRPAPAALAPAPEMQAPEMQAPANDGYLASPVVTGAARNGDSLLLSGQGAPGARMRLASPSGQAAVATADGKGLWRIAAPAAATPQIFGLSMTVDDRLLQAQGYVLVDVNGQVSLLRAGAGAMLLGAGGAPRITAFDYDRGGGAVVSGLAPAGASVTLRVDGEVMGQARADSQGRFAIPVERPVSEGRRQIQVSGPDFASSATVEVLSPEPLDDGPFRSRRTPLGLRADWMTPGGGVQTTLILDGASSG